MTPPCMLASAGEAHGQESLALRHAAARSWFEALGKSSEAWCWLRFSDAGTGLAELVVWHVGLRRLPQRSRSYHLRGSWLAASVPGGERSP